MMRVGRIEKGKKQEKKKVESRSRSFPELRLQEKEIGGK